VPATDIARWVQETKTDPELHENLSRRVGFRLDVKRRLPVGNRLLWYAIVRATKPAFIVETGIYDGIGSLVLLRALERNAQEGADGELLSIDVDADAGFLVDPSLRGRWRKVVGMTSDVLEDEVAGRRIDMLIQDTPHTYDNQSFEFGVAVAHRGDRLVLVDSGGGQTPALEEVVEREGGRRATFREQPRHHFHPGFGTQVAVLDG
jgi:hypothetical protein